VDGPGGETAAPGDHARGFQAKDGAKAFSTREHTVAHGAVNGVRLHGRRREKMFESFVSESSAGGEKLLDFRCHSIEDFTLLGQGIVIRGRRIVKDVAFRFETGAAGFLFGRSRWK
jgi:hypothetical protein